MSKRSDVTDLAVCRAVEFQASEKGRPGDALQILVAAFGLPEKVVWRALERACARNLIEFGVSLNGAWLTAEGRRHIAESEQRQAATSPSRENGEP